MGGVRRTSRLPQDVVIVERASRSLPVHSSTAAKLYVLIAMIDPSRACSVSFNSFLFVSLIKK
jgi:hypothetical protein